jgi:hypothetical protein
VRFTLVSDGSSDRALLPVLIWALRQAGVTDDLEPQWADLRVLRCPPVSLVEKLRTALELYPCDLLFVHRDSEDEPRDNRKLEIERTLNALRQDGITLPYVCVVPVRMQEAWLLIDEHAIRAAAGNPNGNAEIPVPPLNRIEHVLDPKVTLFRAIQIASELRGRRLHRLELGKARLRVAELIDNFVPLRQLPAFQDFEQDLTQVVEEQHWV